MYTYISSLVKHKNSILGWESKDIGNTLVSTILSDYDDVYFVLENTVSPGRHYCFLKDLVRLTLTTDVTLSIALSLLGNLAINTSTVAKTLITRTATFADALQTDWSFKTVKPGSDPDTETVGSLKTDLFLTKDGIDSITAGNSLIVMVNGMAHFTGAAYGGVYAVDAGRTMRRTNSNLINLFNLGQLGECTCKDVNYSMLRGGTSPSISMQPNEIYIHLNSNLMNKSLVLSFGGLLFFEGRILQVINRELGYVKFNYHLLEHGTLIYEIATKLNPIGNNPLMNSVKAGIISKSQAYSFDTIEHLFSMPQTFAIIVNTPKINVIREGVQDGHLKNVLNSYTLPNKPIVSFSNRFLPYRFTDERGKYAIHVDEYAVPRFSNWTVCDVTGRDYKSFGKLRTLKENTDACAYLLIQKQTLE